MGKLIFTIFVSCLLVAVSGQKGKYKVCAYQKDVENCAFLERGDSPVVCATVQDSNDCAIYLKNGKADFGVFYPEQALLAASFIDNETAVLADIRPDSERYAEYSFQTVVLVPLNYTGGLQNLRGRKYCHPGFDYEDTWTDRILKTFEDAAVQASSIDRCRSVDTAVEQEVAALSELFGSSCRPGSWAGDNKDLDAKLKAKYPNLCSLCDSPSLCAYKSPADPSGNAVTCLLDNEGEVAYTSLRAAQKLNLQRRDISLARNFKLLCPDGSTQNLNASFFVAQACTWANQPWTTIVSRIDKYYNLTTDIQTYLPDVLVNPYTPPLLDPRSTIDWKQYFKNVLLPDKTSLVKVLDRGVSLTTFFQNHSRPIPQRGQDQCNSYIKWCTASDQEQSKCEWWAQASLNRGIRPELTCVQGADVFSCIDSINSSVTDLMAINSNYGYLARRKSLEPLMYMETSSSELSQVTIIVRRTSNIQSFSDLKGKSACFPEYGGISWVAFTNAARDQGIISKSACDFAKEISNLFVANCAPGANQQNHEVSQNSYSDNLCSLCTGVSSFTTAVTCNASPDNKFYGNSGALQCLSNGVADVAVIEKTNVRRDLALLSETDYQILCRNGTLASIRTTDLNCALSLTVNGEIIVQRASTRKLDFKQAMLQEDKWFNINQKITQTMDIFASFNNTRNLLFPNSAIGFDDASSVNQYVQNYRELFSKVDSCSSASTVQFTSLLLVIVSLFKLF